MRRALVLLVACLGLTCVGTAGADESIDDGRWEGSELSSGPKTVKDFGSITLSGSFTRTPHRPFDVEVRADNVAGSPGCTVEGSGRFDPDPPTSPTDGFDFDEDLSVPCNGTYLVEAVARTTENAPDPDGSGPLVSPAPPDSAILDRTVTVVVPPPDVSGVDAVAGEDRAVTVTWLPVAPKPDDHAGYLVLRTASDGGTTAFSLDDVTSFVDSNPPAVGGDTTYAVVARRPGATSGSEVRSTSPGTKTVTVSAAPVDPGGTGGTTDGGTGGGGTGGGATGGTSGGGTGSTGGSGGVVVPGGRPSSAIQVPRVGTPSRNFFPALLAPPVDTGFSEELPYGDREPGEEAAILPDDLASDPLPGKGLAIPLATGLVLAVWALHLRFLARASRPQYYDQDDDVIEVIVL